MPLPSAPRPKPRLKTPLSLGTGAPQQPEGGNNQTSNNTRWINRAWPIHTLERHSATLEKVPSERSPRTGQDSVYGVLRGQ